MARKTTSDPGVLSGARNQKSLVLMLGDVISIPVDMYSPKQSKGDDLVSVCPTCHDDAACAEHEVKQKYFGEDCKHGPFSYPEVLRAAEDDAGDLVVVGTPEEVKQAKQASEDADRTFRLVAHPYTELCENTYPVGTPYVLRPTPGTSSPLFALFLATVAADGRVSMGDKKAKTLRDVALVGEAATKGNPKLFMLRTWKGQLVAQEICRPENLHQFAEVPGDADKRFLPIFEQAIELVEMAFDPDNYQDAQRQRLETLIANATAEAAGGDVIPMHAASGTVAATDPDDMLAALEASIEAAKAKAS